MSRILEVPYFYQRDNDEALHGPGWRQCNLTSHAMAIDFLKKGQLRNEGFRRSVEPETVYGQALIDFGDTREHHAHTQCLLDRFGIRSDWRTDLSKAIVLKQLDMGFPVPIGVAYRTDGHIICAIGYDDNGLIINDPYGSRYGASDDYSMVGGERDRYSWKLLDSIFWDIGPEHGWGRVIHGLL
jgi:hypothetical protein